MKAREGERTAAPLEVKAGGRSVTLEMELSFVHLPALGKGRGPPVLVQDSARC